MKTGLAAQSTAISTGKQTADEASSEVKISEENAGSLQVDTSKDENSPVESIDSGRANSPVLNTGKSSGQSSVASSLPETVKKEEVAESKNFPWEQQSASKSADESIEIKAEKTEGALPWQQQSSASPEKLPPEAVDSSNKTKEKFPWTQQAANQSKSDALPKDTTENSATSNSEPRIRQVIIDPVTGLYIETGLNSLSNPASESSNMSFENRQEDLLEWPFWEMDGRIGLTVAKSSYNGSVNWQQEGEAIDFRFRGPLGFGGLRIHGRLDEEVRVKATTGQDFSVNDFESEMQARMGWSIPINSLRYWALGIVDPEVDADVVLNEDSLLEELVQGDWKVIYERYEEFDDISLPTKFKITGPDTKIKMIVNDWSIPSAE